VKGADLAVQSEAGGQCGTRREAVVVTPVDDAGVLHPLADAVLTDPAVSVAGRRDTGVTEAVLGGDGGHAEPRGYPKDCGRHQGKGSVHVDDVGSELLYLLGDIAACLEVPHRLQAGPHSRDASLLRRKNRVLRHGVAGLPQERRLLGKHLHGAAFGAVVVV
jgi:hypothetical protein